MAASMGFAPVAVMASTWPGSISSMASAISFEQKPIDRTAIASVPASAPEPKMMTNTSAQMMTFTDRDAEMMNFPRRNEYRLGVVFSAPSSDTGTDSKIASAVPRMAMWTVSIIGPMISPVYPTFGGYIRVTRSMNSRG